MWEHLCAQCSLIHPGLLLSALLCQHSCWSTCTLSYGSPLLRARSLLPRSRVIWFGTATGSWNFSPWGCSSLMHDSSCLPPLLQMTQICFHRRPVILINFIWNTIWSWRWCCSSFPDDFFHLFDCWFTFIEDMFWFTYLYKFGVLRQFFIPPLITGEEERAALAELRQGMRERLKILNRAERSRKRIKERARGRARFTTNPVPFTSKL